MVSKIGREKRKKQASEKVKPHYDGHTKAFQQCLTIESTTDSADSAALVSTPNLIGILFFSDMTLESGLTHNLPTREPKVKQKAETPFFPAATHKYSLTIKQKMAPNSLQNQYQFSSKKVDDKISNNWHAHSYYIVFI